MTKKQQFWALATILVTVVSSLAACSKEELTDLVDSAREQVDVAIEQAKKGSEEIAEDAQNAVFSGSIQLQLDKSVSADVCMANFATSNKGRPSILSLQSYRNPKSVSFPAVYLLATTEASALVELVGTRIPAQMFVQPLKDGPVWTADSSSPIEVSITGFDAGILDVTVVSGVLQHSDGIGSSPISGEFRGVLATATN